MGVGEQHEHVGVDQVRHEGGEPVVVAVADLVVGDGVVLVDDGHDAEVEEAGQRLAGVEVLGALPEVVGGEEHLAGDEASVLEVGREALHEPGLADGGDGLEGADVGRAAGQPEGGQAGRDRARADEHDGVAGGSGVGDLVGELAEGGVVELAGLARDRGGPDLHDRGHRRLGVGSSRYSSSTGPTRTTSPSRAPARSNARSTPRRRNRSRT